MNADYQYIIGRIQNALATDPRVSKLDVNVRVIAGKIHLMGQTSTEVRRLAIAEVVKETIPDMEVRNEITVIEVTEPAQPEVIG
jgi:osmotically-inducible protein OsmY